MNTTANPPALQDNLSKLPAAQQDFVKLRISQAPVKNIENYVVKKALAEILVKASFDMGSPMANDAQVLKFQTEAFFNELKGRFAELTIAELREAFNRGIRGDFGQFFGMCPQTYHKFIKAFFELPERGKAWMEYVSMLEGKNTIARPVYFTPEHLLMFAQNDFEIYKESGKLPFYPHATYNTICERVGIEITINAEPVKTLVPDREKARELFLKAKAEYLGRLESDFKRGRISADEKAKLSDLNRIRSFEFLLKKYYLVAFFDKLIENNKPLEL